MDTNQNYGIVMRGNPAEPAELALARTITTTPVDSIFTWEQGVRIIRKNRVSAIVFAAVATLLVAGYALSLKDVYTPIARVEVDPPSAGIKTLEIEWNNSNQSDTDYLETHSQMLNADSLALSVVRALHLDRNPKFVGQKAIAAYGNQDAGPPSAGDGPGHPYLEEEFRYAQRTPLESIALGKLQHNLATNTVHASRIIEVSYSDNDPKLAQDILNTLVTNYMDQNYKRRYASTMQASDWLAGQLDGLKKKVAVANQIVTEYQKRYGIVDVDVKNLPLAEQMAEVNHQLAVAQATRIEDEAYIRMIDAGQSEAIPVLRDDLLYTNLMGHSAETKAALAQARSIYGDENPNVKKLEQEVDEYGQEAEAERARVLKQLHTAYEAAKVQESMMLKTRDDLRPQLGDSASRMVQYNTLRSDAQADSVLYDTLKGRLFEAGVYAGLGYTNIHIVDLAPRLRTATGPHRELIVAIGAIASSFMALVLVFVKEGLNNTVRTPDDIKDWTGLPSLAMIPPINQSSNGNSAHGLKLAPASVGIRGARRTSSSHLLMTANHTPEAEAMRDLRTAIMLSRPGGAPKVVLVASSAPSEGKTTVAINLATVFAQRGKTCLIDGDLRKPQVANAFALRGGRGLSHLLTGSATLDEVLWPTPDVPNLSILPVGVLPPNPADLIASEPMRLAVLAAREKFEHVVIDSPPAIPFSDARVLSSLADVVVVVGRYGVTTRRAITRCAQIFDEVGAPIVGVVVNDIRINSADYHYYNYGYSKILTGDVYGYYKDKPDHNAPPDPPGNDRGKAKGAHA